MKKWVSVAIALSLLIGCAGKPRPFFDLSYLPGAIPGSPQQKISLSDALEKKLAWKKSFFGKITQAPPARIVWIENDTLLVTVLKTEKGKRDTWLYSFTVHPATGEVKLLSDAEQDAIRKTIERNPQSPETSVLAEIGGAVVTLAMAIVSGGRAAGSGGGSGSSFDGTIENNGWSLSMQAKLGTEIAPFSKYQWRYRVTNNRTGRTLKGHYRPGKDSEEAFESWLKSWRISPDGRYYLIGKTASLIDSEGGKKPATFMKGYPYAGLDVSPSWDRLALLMMESNEQTGRIECWIELYPFAYR